MDDANRDQRPDSEFADLISNATAGDDGISRDGDLLMIRKSARLPNRCIMCNAPTTNRVTMSLQGRSFSTLAAALFFGASSRRTSQAAAHAAFASDESEAIRVALCEQHQIPKRRIPLLSGSLALIGAALVIMVVVLAVKGEGVGAFLLGLLTTCYSILAVAIHSTIGSKPAIVKKIDRGLVWLRVPPEYLVGYPQRVQSGRRKK